MEDALKVSQRNSNRGSQNNTMFKDVKKHKGPSSIRSENPRDNVAVKSNNLNFHQMLD